MATDLQHKTLERTVEVGRTKKRIIKRQILRDVGYSEAVAAQPHKVFESKGFLALCDEIGLTDDFLTKALYDDIKAKPKRREKELRLAFQVKQKLNDNEKHGNTINVLNIFDRGQAERIAGRILTSDTTSEIAPDRLHDSDEPELHTELPS